MEWTNEALENVFAALDTEKNGFITIDKFKSNFESYLSNSCDIAASDKSISGFLQKLQLQEDGVVTFLEFRRALRDIIDVPATPTLDIDQKSRSLFDTEAEDSGYQGLNEVIYRDENSLSTHLVRGEQRSSWPKRLPNPQYSNREVTGSPLSGSRSDILIDELDYNYEALKDQLARVEKRMDGQNRARVEELESRLDREKQENAQLTTQLALLEERLKEADARHARELEVERTHHQHFVSHLKLERESEVEQLKARINDLEKDVTTHRDMRFQLQAQLEISQKECRKQQSSVVEAHDTINALRRQLDQRLEAKQISTLKEERDHALQRLQAANGSHMDDPVSSQGSNASEILAGSELNVSRRFFEAQELLRRVTEENKMLKRQLIEVNEELLTASVAQGHQLLQSSQQSWAHELDGCSKEELSQLLCAEKETNEHLQNYVRKLLERVMEKYEDVLEVR